MGKISLSNIADELAAKSGITHEAADTFVHSFIGTIEKGLKEDGMVKVKGLGTFKLMEVSDRGSVDVNTGERIVIKGYRKIAFTPDSAMKELVNRPFAHFEPTELNEGFPAEEELETLDNSADDADVEAAEEVVETILEESATECPAVEEPVNEEPVAELSEPEESVAELPATEELVVVDSIAEEPIVEETLAEEAMPVAEEAVVADSVVEEPSVEKETKTEEPVAVTAPVVEQRGKKRRKGGCLWGLLLLVVAVLVLVYGYFTLGETASNEPVEDLNAITVKSNLEEELGAEWSDDTEVEEPVEMQSDKATLSAPKDVVEEKQEESRVVVAEKAKPVAVAEVAKPATENPFCAVVITASLQEKTIKDITPADTADYIMGETLVTHTLKNGETIIALAKKYYGDKRLWPYIVKYNKMKNFNSVAIGQKIKVPVLKEKTIE